jgi:hypothetical protein
MPDTQKELDIVGVTELDVETKLRDFSALLDELDNLNEKKRALWKDIYTNALSDRQNSYVMFTQLFKLTDSKSTEYAVHGRTLTACIERMSKANEQLIKLAELIARAERGNEEIDANTMFDRIKGGK